MVELSSLDHIAHPDKLTAKYWDKHKSLTGKIQVKDTGIGDALKTLDSAFKSITWDTIRIHNNEAGSGNHFNLKAWKQALADAVKDVKTGNVATYILALETVQDKCKAAAKRFTEKKLKDDVKLTAELEAEVEKVLKTVAEKPLVEALTKYYTARVEGFEVVVAGTRKKLRSNISIAMIELGNVFKTPTPAGFNSAMTAVRAVTQTLFSNERYAKAGLEAPLDAEGATKAFGKLEPYAGQQKILELNVPPETVKTEVIAVLGMLKQAQLLCD